MTPLVALCVVLGASLGAPLRVVVERTLAGGYPRGTLLVNVVGSALLGLLAGAASTSDAPPTVALALLGTGFCGSLTTFGGFAAQVLDLAAGPPLDAPGGRAGRALGYGAISVVGCVGVAALTYGVAVAVSTR